MNPPTKPTPTTPKAPVSPAAKAILTPNKGTAAAAPPSLARPVRMADLKLTSKSRMLLLGTPGSGKTVLGCTLPKPLILDLDNNIEGPVTFLSRSGILTPDEMNDIIIVRPFFDADGNLLKRSDRWQALGRAITAYLKEFPDRESIFIDGLSSLVTAAADEVRRQEKAYIAEAELGDPLKLDKTVDDAMRIQDWGSFAVLMEQFFIRLSGKNKNVVVSAHIHDRETEKESGIYKTYINCPGSFAEKIAGMFTECWLMTRETSGIGAGAKSTVYIQTVAGGRMAPLGLKSAKQVGVRVEVDLKKIRTLFV